MLEAHAVLQRGHTQGDWEEWQTAAAEYWLVRHPEARPTSPTF